LIRKAIPSRRSSCAPAVNSKSKANKGIYNDSDSESKEESGSNFSASGGTESDESYLPSGSETSSRTKRKKQPQPKIARYFTIAKELDRSKDCYICKLDDLTFDSVPSARDHLKEAHGIDMNDDFIQCQECKKTFRADRISSYKKHLLAGHLTKCDVCGKKFASKRHISRHKLQKHSTNGNNGKVKCNVCDQVLSSRSSLQQHMLLHFPKRKYRCQECGQQFTQAAGLSGHMRRVHNAPLTRKKVPQDE